MGKIFIFVWNAQSVNFWWNRRVHLHSCEWFSEFVACELLRWLKWQNMWLVIALTKFGTIRTRKLYICYVNASEKLSKFQSMVYLPRKTSKKGSMNVSNWIIYSIIKFQLSEWRLRWKWIFFGSIKYGR